MQNHRDKTISSLSPAIPALPSQLPQNVTGIPRDLLSANEISITESKAEVLLSQLASGELSAVDVTTAFLRRAGLAQKLVNCVTELLPERALQRARELDAYLKEVGRPMGPLHGLPVSVKEHVGMKGLSLTGGFVSWSDRTAEKDAHILTLLWNAGAVFYARTTEPQSIMHLETSSNLYGVTVNPFNTLLTAGGSSGGEGALMGIKGSCLGIGTDIGGSIRSPAANCGVFGFKPTSYRLPMGGLVAPGGGAEQIVPTVGPLSTSAAGLELFMQVLIGQEPWKRDPSLVPLSWRSGMLSRSSGSGKRKLKIGILADDGVVRPHPPVGRALDHVISLLRQAKLPDVDIELVEFKPMQHAEAWRIISSLYFADGGADQSAVIDASGEPWRPLTKFILKGPNVKALSMGEMWGLTEEREKYRKQYCEHWTRQSGAESGEEDGEHDEIDVLLTPVGPGAAPLLDTARYWGYTSQWNLLDYPAAVFPTGLFVEPEVDVKDTGYQPRNEEDEYNYKLCKYFPVLCWWLHI